MCCPFGRPWYREPNAISSNRLRKVFQSITSSVIRLYDEAGNVIEMHEHAGEFKES
jgi:hypothetical protein